MSTRIGNAFEKAAKRYLESHGLFVVRSAGSHGPADLVALIPGGGAPMLIQCKVSGDLRVREWNDLVKVARRFNTMPVLASRSKDHGGEIEFFRLTATRPLRSLDSLPMVRLVFEIADAA